MKIPKRMIGPWARELIDECTVSQPTRRENIKLFKNYYNNGTETGDQAKVQSFVSATSTGFTEALFSPADVRFDIELDMAEEAETVSILEAGTRFLNREFSRCGVDLATSDGVNWALVKGATLIKMVWGHNGLEPWLVHPEMFGVLREDITDLNRQEAMVHTSWLTQSAFKRTLVEHPERAGSHARKVEALPEAARTDQDFTDSYFRTRF